MRLSRILLLLATLGLAFLCLASCAGRERGPLFLDGEGGAQRARPAGEGRYLLKRAIPPGAADRAFYLRYRPAAEGAGAGELRVLDPSGGVLVRAELKGAPTSLEVNQQAALPPGSRVAGFTLAVEAGRRPEILEAGLARPFAGFEQAPGRLHLGIGVRGLLLSPGSMQVELAPESYGVGDQGWRIELDYALAGPADWADLRLLEDGQEPSGRARARLTAAAGGRRAAFELDALPGARRWFLHPGTIGFAPARLALRPLGGGQAAVLRLEVVPQAARAQGAGPALDPLPADPATVLHYDPRYWRQPDYELFAWERFPGLLILDTADYAVQDRFFKRLAFFVEKEGFRGRLVTEQEVRGLHGYNAHDYRAEDLERFFSAANAQGFALNPEEELLRAILAANGILGGQGAVLSISRESSEVLRDLLLTHEAFHGLFFTLPRYREACQAVWEDLQGSERRFWSLFLDWGSYDYRDGYLAANELQAYLFQQSRADLNFYFRHLTAGRLEKAFPREAPWLREFLGSGGGGFEAAFDRLAPALRREAGLQGGRVLEWKKAQ